MCRFSSNVPFPSHSIYTICIVCKLKTLKIVDSFIIHSQTTSEHFNVHQPRLCLLSPQNIRNKHTNRTRFLFCQQASLFLSTENYSTTHLKRRNIVKTKRELLPEKQQVPKYFQLFLYGRLAFCILRGTFFFKINNNNFKRFKLLFLLL